MCCNAHSKADPANEAPSNHVDDTLVATPLPDGYWLHAFPFDNNSAFPDLLGYGLGFQDKSAAIKLLINPKNSGASGWKLTEIQKLDFPVGMVYADLTGNGLNDIIICDRYGPSMDKASNGEFAPGDTELWDAKTENGGRLQWLQNPGDRDAQPYWTEHHIGNSTGMHRYYSVPGHFTETDHFQVMGLPIIPKSSDLTSPAPIIIYTPAYGEDPSQGPQSWSENIAFHSEFRLIHDAKLLPGTNGGLDMVLVAGREGIALLWFNNASEKWEHRIVGSGLPQMEDNPYWGSGSVDVVRVGDDPVGYVAACEGFHGNIVSVYTKPPHSTKGPASLKENIWTRRVIDDFGPLNSAHTGTIHHVQAFHGATDSFGIACMGAHLITAENQGVYVYTPTDKVAFKKTKVTEESAGRLAVASFTGTSKEGFPLFYFEIASISYYVPGYHTGPDPPSIRINSVEQCNMASRTTISATKLNKEVLLRVPRPGVVPYGVIPSMPLVTIAGKNQTLVVLRPDQVIKLEPSAGAKVIYGSIEMTTPNKAVVTRTIAPAVKETATTHPLSSDGTVKAGKGGAVFILVEALDGHFQGPYHAMDQITTTNMFTQVPHVPANVKAMEFPFIKVEDLSWENLNSTVWNDFEFYNMTGFYIYFNDDTMEEICHMQAWTLGIGETVSIHNHSDRSFCEIHYCLSNGGGKGSMRYFADDDTEDIDTAAELTGPYVESRSTQLIVPTMFEHGPLWKILPNTKWTPQLRPNDTADYPWHAWLASEFGDRTLPIIPPLPKEQQLFDLWLAFEFPTSAFQE
ncbi:hypothetical protein C8R45DRAFT_1185748 [Mycena sanguinolenta]|nr:hypothetical protein C8R45DRAFT_1185748 [Mycena sanguinolenta]